MKKSLSLLLALALSLPAMADPSSHRKAAEDLVAAVAGPDLVKAGFSSALEPMFNNMRQGGAPDAMIAEFKSAIEDWFKAEIKWEELGPLLVDLYVQEYTEADLAAINAFIKTPAGQKMVKSSPVLMQKGMQIGQQYAMAKQASLQEKLQAIAARYQAAEAAAAAPAAEAAPAPSPAPAAK